MSDDTLRQEREWMHEQLEEAIHEWHHGSIKDSIQMVKTIRNELEHRLDQTAVADDSEVTEE